MMMIMMLIVKRRIVFVVILVVVVVVVEVVVVVVEKCILLFCCLISVIGATTLAGTMNCRGLMKLTIFVMFCIIFKHKNKLLYVDPYMIRSFICFVILTSSGII